MIAAGRNPSAPEVIEKAAGDRVRAVALTGDVAADAAAIRAAAGGGAHLRNDWEIVGKFMYPASACRSLIKLVRAGLLDLAAIRPQVFPLAALPEAIDAAESAGNLEVIVARP